MAKVIRGAQARYEVQDVDFGKVYKWCPERVVLECGCGGRLYLTSSMTSCEECSADHAVAVREELSQLRQSSDETLHPWRYSYSEDHDEDAGLPF